MKKGKKAFKILSIDGGGIKGLYSASVLSKLEKVSGKKSGDCFDLICGTSTGGLIALGLAAGKDAKDLVSLYYEKGNKIFPTSKWRFCRFLQRSIFHTITQTFLFGKYSSKSLEKHLKETFGELKLGELNNLVCIPSYNLTSGMPRMFKYPHKEGGFFKDKEIPVLDAALATSAAPTYFPIHEYNDTLYIDGGVWANNPSLSGLLEAICYFVGDEEDKEYSHIELLSVASISQASGWVSGVRKRRSFIGWRSKLLETSMNGQAYFTDFFLKKSIKLMNQNNKYVRIESPKLSCDQMEVLSMDRADIKALKTLKSIGEQDGAFYALDDEVMNFYRTLKTYKTD